MTERIPELLIALAQRLSTLSDDIEADRRRLGRLRDTANSFAESWSGSNSGFRSTTYYRDFSKPTFGERFGKGRTLLRVMVDSMGPWTAHSRDYVHSRIRSEAGDPDLTTVVSLSDEARGQLAAAKDEAESLLTAYLSFNHNDYLLSLKTRISQVDAITYENALAALLEASAAQEKTAKQKLSPAPHQEVLARVSAIIDPFEKCKELARLVQVAAEHIDSLTTRSGQVESPGTTPPARRGTHVFIGHGRSPQWRELKDFLQDRLGLSWDEFNRVPVAGVSNVERLASMLDEAAMAFLVLTAEDERADGAVTARQNVVHEVGLFQGRLGFSRAIVMLEEGCADFSNIHGLGQIHYPAGRIAASFEDVRRVLEREGLLGS
ncbi:Predicted nucleotide-binding protein containing TIR-like domain-containing protein [Lentzea fradiae]|uniref:Predicted nucleotide-binding protein containing TIR-like domain-containing protein n=1 Tax=Lentzea fradiae TaxID=200378 RepID=A0A1G7PYS8_9PSEU|nr:TIR domain-containing protein [Lentzea fradiae]SDF91425.1 Predicted nucleotide-binding protein containing TIR-like domain-containing protein [Lentzea fradiae]